MGSQNRVTRPVQHLPHDAADRGRLPGSRDGIGRIDDPVTETLVPVGTLGIGRRLFHPLHDRRRRRVRGGHRHQSGQSGNEWGRHGCAGQGSVIAAPQSHGVSRYRRQHRNARRCHRDSVAKIGEPCQIIVAVRRRNG